MFVVDINVWNDEFDKVFLCRSDTDMVAITSLIFPKS